MKWKSTYKHPKLWQFIIEEEIMRDILNDENIRGYFLYVLDTDGDDLHDYMQDDLDTAKEQAFEDFDVPLNSWVEVEVDNT